MKRKQSSSVAAVAERGRSRRKRKGRPRLPSAATNTGTRPRVVISKHSRTLTLLDGEEEVLRWPVVIGKNPSDKEREGDLATPQGDFYVCYKNSRSKYHRFLGLSYPNIEDAERGLRVKLITRGEFAKIREAIARKKCPPWKTALGGEVGIHGPCPNVTWTHGCIALTVAQIERLYELLEIGDEVSIRP